MITTITTALSFDFAMYFLKIQNIYDDINKTRKRKTCTKDLQSGKTYREISKVARISPRDIEVILNKVIEQKKQKNQKKNKNSYLFPLNPTNSFPIQRIN